MIRPAPSAIAGFVGVFMRVPPSTYQPGAFSSLTWTGGNAVGIAVEARTCSELSLAVFTYTMPRSRSAAGTSPRVATNTTVRPVRDSVATTAAVTRPAATLSARRSNGISRSTVCSSGAGSSSASSRPRPNVAPAR